MKMTCSYALFECKARGGHTRMSWYENQMKKKIYIYDVVLGDSDQPVRGA